MSDRKKEMGRLADRAKRNQPDDDSDSETKTAAEGSEEEPSESDRSDTEPSETADTNTRDETTTGDDTNGNTTEVRHVKDRPSVYMYLPQAYSKDLDIACQMINLTYQRETGDKLPKNRYLYPIVTKVGFENAAELSFEEIQEMKTEIDDIDVEETETDE